MNTQSMTEMTTMTTMTTMTDTDTEDTMPTTNTATPATPKRGQAPKKREAQALLQLAIELGGRVPLDPPTLIRLALAGVPAHRVTNAASDLRKYYGVPVTSEKVGRKVTAYVVTLDPVQSLASALMPAVTIGTTMADAEHWTTKLDAIEAALDLPALSVDGQETR